MQVELARLGQARPLEELLQIDAVIAYEARLKIHRQLRDTDHEPEPACHLLLEHLGAHLQRAPEAIQPCLDEERVEGPADGVPQRRDDLLLSPTRVPLDVDLDHLFHEDLRTNDRVLRHRRRRGATQ